MGALLAFMISRQFVLEYAPRNQVLYDALSITRGALRGAGLTGAVSGAIVGLRHYIKRDKRIEISDIFDADYRLWKARIYVQSVYSNVGEAAKRSANKNYALC